MVLTYNLVEKGATTVPRAPEGDSVSDMASVLTDYNRAAEIAKTDDWPSYLIYRLEHKYSQPGLTLKGLKGKDEISIKLLDSACQKAGYDLYLGMVEKTLHKDDDCGDEVFDREEGFKYINDLDGTKIDANPEYDKDFVINMDGYETEDDEADEEEHSGYTGNEGCPAEYIYRDSVAIIVPSRSRVDFAVNEKADNYTAIMKVLADFSSRTFEKGSYEFEQLARLLGIVVARQNKQLGGYHSYMYWAPDHQIGTQKVLKEYCMEEIACVALKWDLDDIWEEVKAEYRMRPKALEASGAWLVRSQPGEAFDESLQKMLETAQGIAARFEAVKSIKLGIRSENDCEVVVSEFSIFVVRMLKKWLAEFSTLRKVDGKALADMLWKHGHENSDIQLTILTRIESAHPVTIVAFVNQLMSFHIGEGLLSDRIRYPLSIGLELLRDKFDYETPIHPPPTSTIFVRLNPTASVPDVLNSQDLWNLLEAVNNAGNPQISARTMLAIFDRAVPESPRPMPKSICSLSSPSSSSVPSQPSTLSTAQRRHAPK